MPTKAGLGTDMLALHPETTRARAAIPPPASGYVACTPLPVDVAIVHGDAADARGNVRVDPKLVWMDSELVQGGGDDDRHRRADRPGERASAPSRTAPRIRASRSTTVVEAPWGAYPTSCFPRYAYDGDFFRSYAAAHADPAACARSGTSGSPGPETHAAFLDANGGARTLLSIARRTP